MIKPTGTIIGFSFWNKRGRSRCVKGTISKTKTAQQLSIWIRYIHCTNGGRQLSRCTFTRFAV